MLTNNSGYYLKTIIRMIDAETMEFEAHLDKDCGYISLGFGEHMDGHDMWVWERDEDRFGQPIGTVRDLWSFGRVTPDDDDT